MDAGFSAARVGLRFIAVDSEARGRRRLRASSEWSQLQGEEMMDRQL
jgi:hypothetical protein